jgi:hypothetical protein
MEYYVSVVSYLFGLLIYDNSCVIQNINEAMMASSWPSIAEINSVLMQ